MTYFLGACKVSVTCSISTPVRGTGGGVTQGWGRIEEEPEEHSKPLFSNLELREKEEFFKNLLIRMALLSANIVGLTLTTTCFRLDKLEGDKLTFPLTLTNEGVNEPSGLLKGDRVQNGVVRPDNSHSFELSFCLFLFLSHGCQSLSVGILFPYYRVCRT